MTPTHRSNDMTDKLRDDLLKRADDIDPVLEVEFELDPAGRSAPLRYGELTAALDAAAAGLRVVVVTKDAADAGSTRWAQGGVAVVVGSGLGVAEADGEGEGSALAEGSGLSDGGGLGDADADGVGSGASLDGGAGSEGSAVGAIHEDAVRVREERLSTRTPAGGSWATTVPVSVVAPSSSWIRTRSSGALSAS